MFLLEQNLNGKKIHLIQQNQLDLLSEWSLAKKHIMPWDLKDFKHKKLKDIF